MNDEYMTADEHGDNWRLWLGEFVHSADSV